MNRLEDTLEGALARAYCTERNLHKILDPGLIMDMKEEVITYLASKSKLSINTATKLALETEYAIEANTHGINPINEADAGAFFLEGFNYASESKGSRNE